MDIVQKTKKLYKEFGQSKSMEIENEPCYFLQRNFKGEQDMLIIFKTPPCNSHCKFCNLSNREWNEGLDITKQFAFVVEQLKHSLSVLDRVTLSNNGSILDPATVPFTELEKIIQAITQVRNITTIVLETDLKYVNETLLKNLQQIAGKTKLNILTGFETLDERVMLQTLGKCRNQNEFENKLSIIADCKCDFTAHILYKPSQNMNDEEAYIEAKSSALYLIEECKNRNIRLTLRINPMFAAIGTVWAEKALQTPSYSPPKISDVYHLALELNKYVTTYIGLSTENKNEEWGSYRIHHDLTQNLLLDIIHFNGRKC